MPAQCTLNPVWKSVSRLSVHYFFVESVYTHSSDILYPQLSVHNRSVLHLNVR